MQVFINYVKKGGADMPKKKTKYPIILVHGLILKDVSFFKAFGRIEKHLRENGYCTHTCKTDGVGSIENNASQLKRQIYSVMKLTGTKKVNLICHSKGGLDSRYMIENLGMEKHIASVTFICTPHSGSQVASLIYRLPYPVKRGIALGLDTFYKLIGDKNPDSLTVCRQLTAKSIDSEELLPCYEGIYLQSYWTELKKGSDDFIMSIPLVFSRMHERTASDGLVTEKSSRFGEYKGRCTEHSVSHTQIVDLLVCRKKRGIVLDFYTGLCEDLAKRGF